MCEVRNCRDLGDQPRVRTFAMWFCDDTGFYYPTGTPKKIFGRLKENPMLELCFFRLIPF